MKVLIIGSGGREHAIAHKISTQNKGAELFVAPGNGGISLVATCVDIKANDFQGLVSFAKAESIDFTIVGMDEPLVLGIVDEFEKNNLRIFGPNKKAAQIEGSKSFSKKLMDKYNIPTAAYEIFDSYDKAAAYAEKAKYPLVVKADGLALGKGVLICDNYSQCIEALKSSMLENKFGGSGDIVVIEEFLQGSEASLLAFCDGENIVPMVSAKDHKKIFEGELGPNTGGMGAISPSSHYTEDIAAAAMGQIFERTLYAIKSEGIVYKGVLFFGLMLTESGPKVIEYNARFGDPEAQVVLPRLKSDLLEIMLACTEGRLGEINIEWDDNAVCCVVLASNGYPNNYKTGYKVTGLDEIPSRSYAYHAGTKLLEDGYYTSGGRVVGISTVAGNISGAIDACYEDLKKVNFEGVYFRKDIGKN
ncbi:MAG: phosphoribosylamine--glycine ligase [Clostridiales bacterium]|jgi:phosphoribosylamine--glycine ligase|nr:phosphoribosylamine--glycine ligase [Clostridiales bacterium]